MGNAGSTALCQAAARGDLPALKAVADRIDIDGRDEDGWSALHYSAWLGHDEVVRELLIRGAEPNIRDGVRQQICLGSRRCVSPTMACIQHVLCMLRIYGRHCT